MIRTLMVLTVALSAAHAATPQSSGIRGGTGSGQPPQLLHASDPPPASIDRYIVISAHAEVRIAPTMLRVVFAVTTEAPIAADCLKLMRSRIGALTRAVGEEGVEPSSIVSDYISLLPVYAWKVEKQSGRDVAVERRVSSILQHNVHVQIPSEARAQAVIARGLEAGFGDVIAVDHWSSELEKARADAQEKALAEAQRKARLLLDPLFTARPLPINIHEHTTVVYPKDLYRSVINAYESQFRNVSYSGRLPTMAVHRPKNTYLEGFFHPVDVRAGRLPMKPEISVVATIKIYYASPARQDASDPKTPGKPK
ncbi:MAG: hypothetical protein CMJ83_03265 [Planctomycetes bacterium]|nr:hypothetical protein [Planctomycetota bacterium]